jgi:DNA polymerase-1
MIRAHQALADEGLATRMILTIHDELLFEGPPEETDAVRAIIEREMLAPWDDRTPPLAVDVGVGQTWLDAK